MNSKNAWYLLWGRTLSTCGDSIYQIAVIWYVYHLTNDTIYTGIAIACSSAPQVFNFIFGPIIEVLNKQKILKYSQFVQFFLMALVPIGILFNYENVYFVCLVILLVSFVENFQGTAEMSIVPALMDSTRIGSYNALNNTLQQSIHLIVAALFSIIIIYIGIRDIYFFNTATYFLAFLFFAKIKLSTSHREQTPIRNIIQKQHIKIYRQQLHEGMHFFSKSRLLLITLPFIIANGLLSAVNAILPKYAELLGDADYYGFLMFAISIGVLIGSLLSPLMMNWSVGRIFIIFPIMTGLLWLSSLIQHNGWISIVLFGIALIPFSTMNIIFLTLNQQSIPDRFLSRVLSISDSALFIAIPVGSLIGGYLASDASPLIIMYGGGAAFLCIGLFYLIHPFLRKLPVLTKLKL